MKKALLISLFLFFWTLTNAQVRPEAFLGLLPHPPKNVCSEDRAGETEFMNTISEVSIQLNEEIDRRKEEAEESHKPNEDKMLQNVMARTGVSPEMMKKLMAQEQKNEGEIDNEQNEDETDEMVDQVLQESHNVSKKDLENLDKLNEAGQKAWATAYATEKKAEVMAEPEKYQQQNAKGMKDFQLLTQQKQLNDSLLAQQQKFMKQFQNIENDKSGMEILVCIKKTEADLQKLYKQPDQDFARIKALKQTLRNDEKSYCILLSPKYSDVLTNYQTFTKASILPYLRLEKLTYNVMASKTGINLKFEPGLLGLQQIKEYLIRLSNAYKYNRMVVEITFN